MGETFIFLHNDNVLKHIKKKDLNVSLEKVIKMSLKNPFCQTNLTCIEANHNQLRGLFNKRKHNIKF